MIIGIIDGVAGISMLINSTCDVKWWEIAITSEDSSNISKDLDGSVVFVKPLPPPGGHLPRPVFSSPYSIPATLRRSPAVSLSYPQALSALLFVKGFPRLNQNEEG